MFFVFQSYLITEITELEFTKKSCAVLNAKAS